MGDRRKKYLSQWEIEKVVEEDLPSDTSSIDWDSDDSSNDPDFPDPTTSLTVTCPSDTSSDSNDETPTTVPVNRPQQSSNVVTSSLVCENPENLQEPNICGIKLSVQFLPLHLRHSVALLILFNLRLQQLQSYF